MPSETSAKASREEGCGMKLSIGDTNTKPYRAWLREVIV
jgi:hypothetical protein